MNLSVKPILLVGTLFLAVNRYNKTSVSKLINLIDTLYKAAKINNMCIFTVCLVAHASCGVDQRLDPLDVADKRSAVPRQARMPIECQQIKRMWHTFPCSLFVFYTTISHGAHNTRVTFCSRKNQNWRQFFFSEAAWLILTVHISSRDRPARKRICLAAVTDGTRCRSYPNTRKTVFSAQRHVSSAWLTYMRVRVRLRHCHVIFYICSTDVVVCFRSLSVHMILLMLVWIGTRMDLMFGSISSQSF
jgi:hypothetical protein